MKNDENILLVDDEPLVLKALERALSTNFRIEMAAGPEEALQMLADRGPFAVVVSDYRMPVMNGVRFLARVKTCSPDTVRVMLTGQADLNAAIAAVNEGYVFRFLAKPCPSAVLSTTLEAALEQYRLVIAERELLHCTLMGTVTMLTEILSAVYPSAFSRSFRIRQYVAVLAKAFGLQDAWQLEVAAILSQIGCMTLPLPTAVPALHKDLLEDNPYMFSQHPLAAAGFLRRIPRLEITAEIVALQQKPYHEYDPEVQSVNGHLVALGGQILRIAIDLERLIRLGSAFPDAIREMRSYKGEYNPAVLDALQAAGEPLCQLVPASVTVADLDTSMIADEDIRARNGPVMVAKGEQLTYPLLERLRNFAKSVGIVEPIQVLSVRLPQDTTFRHPGQDGADHAQPVPVSVA